MAAETISVTDDEDTNEIVRYVASNFGRPSLTEEYPPHGLVSPMDASGPLLVKMADFREMDPFGHVGYSVAETLAKLSTELNGEFPEDTLRNARANFFPGSAIMGYLLGMVPKLYDRDYQAREIPAAELASTARNSYTPTVKKFASHSKGIANALVTANSRKSRREGLVDVLRGFPHPKQPFDDREFRLEMVNGRLGMVNDTLQPRIWEAEQKVCPAARVKVVESSGQTALKCVWLRMVDIAEVDLFLDPRTLEWARR